MPQEKNEFREAVDKIMEVVMFENWLRFYFIQDVPQKDGAQQKDLRIALSNESLAKIADLYPNLLPLAEQLNGQNVDFETSRRAVLLHVLNYLDNKELPKGMAESVFSSSTFQLEMQMFNTWEQMHEDQLDRGFLDFGAWRDLFARWREQPAARELAAKLSGHAV